MAGLVPAICAPTAGSGWPGQALPGIRITATSERLPADTDRFRGIPVPGLDPGIDPGIQADSADWGDPRITSGDDEDEKSCLHLDSYPDAHSDKPGHHGETKAYLSSYRENALTAD
ncbi:MAG TPA: hypothetical protein VKJ01_28250, partial [Candidatus Solibacter sp.]|nr:hypothetical protein [Candidatus Solibacter sp.]